MYMCAGLWDNGLVDQKGGQMKPAEAGLGLGCGPSRGVSGPETAALDRIEMPMNQMEGTTMAEKPYTAKVAYLPEQPI